MTTLVNCCRCRNIMAPGATACPRCGEPAEHATCSSCQAVVLPDARFCAQCGHELNEQQEQQQPETPPPSAVVVSEQPFVRPWQPSRRMSVGTAVVLSALVVMSAALFGIQRIVFTPEAALRGYFGALADRDASAAMSHLGVQSGMDSRMLSSPDYVPPTDLRITDVRDDGDDRSATVSFKVDGEEHTTGVRLTKRESRSLGVFRDWLIVGMAPTLQIATSPAVSARVDGVEIDKPANTRDPVVVGVFPGRHKVDIADNPLLEGEAATVVAGAGPVQVPLPVRVKASAQQAAEAQVKQYLDRCAAEKTVEPKGCPFAVSSYYDLNNVAWKIATYPRIDVRQQNSTGEVYVATRTGSKGRVILTGTRGTGTPFEDDMTFEVTGRLDVDGGNLVVTPS